MDTPESMRSELAQWNNGAGIDLESWIGCMGNYSLAAGYATLFWPNFVLFDSYILREGFSESSLRAFEERDRNNPRSIEWVMNHLHIAHIHGPDDLTRDKLLLLGNVLKDIYQAKLLWQFPDRPCTVDFYVPEDGDDLIEYQLSFWQKCHE